MQDADAGIPLDNHACLEEIKTHKLCFTGENPENELKSTIFLMNPSSYQDSFYFSDHISKHDSCHMQIQLEYCLACQEFFIPPYFKHDG